MYNRHGAKVKIGSVVKSANSTNEKWTYAKSFQDNQLFDFR